MKIIINERDLEGVQKMEEIKVIYPAEHHGKKHDSESKYHFVGQLNSKGKNYFVVSLIEPSKEYENANFISTTAYTFNQEGKVKPCYNLVTGWSSKNGLEEKLDRHFSILTRNPENLE